MGWRSLLPVCISVSSSNASSSVPKPPGKSANASDSLRNVTLRVKKYLKLISLGSPSMTTFGSTSIGKRIAAPKLRSAPAPSCPASIRPRPSGAEYASPAHAPVRLKHCEAVVELPQGGVDELHLAAVGAVAGHA